MMPALHPEPIAVEMSLDQFPSRYTPSNNVIPSERRLAKRAEEAAVSLCRRKTKDPSTPFHFGRNDASEFILPGCYANPGIALTASLWSTR
jgi:hypothetical protein